MDKTQMKMDKYYQTAHLNREGKRKKYTARINEKVHIKKKNSPQADEQLRIKLRKAGAEPRASNGQ